MSDRTARDSIILDPSGPLHLLEEDPDTLTSNKHRTPNWFYLGLRCVFLVASAQSNEEVQGFCAELENKNPSSNSLQAL